MNLLIKPASGACNMRCRYCFYTDEMAHRENAIFGMMSTDTLDIIVKKTLDSAPGFCTFMFQGGEPTLTGLDFYRFLIKSVSKNNNRKIRVSYAIQTNGYIIDAEWAKFFADNHFLIGLSIDGTRDIHDAYRIDAGGKGTFNRVINAAELFDKYHVDYNILTVITGQTARNAVSIYNYFKKQGFKYQQYIPCIEGFDEDKSSPWTLSPEQYGKFLCRMFDSWYSDIIIGNYIYNRTFENWVGILIGRPPESCGMVGVCSSQYVLEADGSVYPCDFYVLDEYKIGNLITDSFADIDRRRDESGFIEKSETIAPDCNDCRWRFLCRGGCRREREPSSLYLTSTGSTFNTVGLQKNRFCESYLTFFPYAYDRLLELARLAARGAFGMPSSENYH